MKLRATGLALAALALLAVAPARANIGDDLAQLRQHYGSFKAVGGEALFVHGRFSVCVYFDGDKSAMEVFTPTSEDPKLNTFSSDEINALLSDQADGQTWSPAPSKTGKPTWLRSDQRLVARLSPAGSKAHDASVLVIMLNEK